MDETLTASLESEGLWTGSALITMIMVWGVLCRKLGQNH